MRPRHFLYGSAVVGGLSLSGLAAALATSPALAGPLRWHARFAHGPGFCARTAAGTPELAGEELREHLAWWLREAAPSDEQLERITGIAEDALADLCRVHERAAGSRESVAAALAGAAVDRDALAAARSAALANFDAASERALEAVADAADVLSAEQRAKLAAAHEEWHERRAHRHGWF